MQFTIYFSPEANRVGVNKDETVRPADCPYAMERNASVQHSINTMQSPRGGLVGRSCSAAPSSFFQCVPDSSNMLRSRATTAADEVGTGRDDLRSI